jgi:hypothetical protein
MSETAYNSEMNGKDFNDRGEFDYEWEDISLSDQLDAANAVESIIADCRSNLKD